ncbi:LysR family transcriptional regulator [Amycolatopsis suaedae]|uniref:LysR family transcriptional regulator n=1 Tax=Amycolatopsis suaedae TaxID=2510978 RepID=A0A4Q7J2Q4_9PSEU|nr:LysR family transcriptional regulator [Amycolatopsis suaedae]RZQ61038.1 LysR family transcriptional regulator [Amycolatopsis suaedae]
MIDAVATAGSISKAAARLDLTQPAVSTMLRRVERHLGVRLFNRSSEGVELTAVGAEVAYRARAILAGVDDLTATLRGVQPGAVAVLRVGGQMAPALIRLCARIGALWPRARIQLRLDAGSGRILALLASGALDIALVYEPVPEPVTVPFNVDRCVLVDAEPLFAGVPADSALASRETLALADLAGQEWVDDPLDDGPWPTYLRRRCAEAGFVPSVSYWTGSWDVGASLIRSGRAVGIYHATAPPREGIVFRRLRGDPLAHRVVLLSRRERRDASLRLRAEIGRIYQGLVADNPLYARWWDENPQAHPAMPAASIAHAG